MPGTGEFAERRAERRVVPLLPPGAPLWFPEPEEGRDSGLVAAGGDLSVMRLLFAYSQGIFPWYGQDTPILWWSPDPRCVLFPGEIRIPRNLRRAMRRQQYAISFNKDFDGVIRHCASVPRPGQKGTWLVPELTDALRELNRMGHAWSCEAWEGDDLAGGLYGVWLGRVFFGESMFHLRPDASKIAFIAMMEMLRQKGVALVDCQQTTPHMLRLGAREISRAEFRERLDAYVGGVAG